MVGSGLAHVLRGILRDGDGTGAVGHRQRDLPARRPWQGERSRSCCQLVGQPDCFRNAPDHVWCPLSRMFDIIMSLTTTITTKRRARSGFTRGSHWPRGSLSSCLCPKPRASRWKTSWPCLSAQSLSSGRAATQTKKQAQSIDTPFSFSFLM